jgi:hypothetical protein
MEFVKHHEPFHFAGFDRVIRTAQKDGYHIGLVVTSKNQHRVCELKTEDLVISVRDLEEGKSVIDFNFFVINASTGRGLYQHYHNSMSITRFGVLLNSRMNALAKQRTEVAIALAEVTSQLSLRAIHELKRSFVTRVLLTQIVREEDLPGLVDEMDRIKRLSFDVAAITPHSELFRPLSGLVKVTRTEIVFDREASFDRVKKAVLELVGRVSPRGGRVVGEDQNGVEQVASLLENYDVFGELEYDDAAGAMNIRIDDFASSVNIKRLLAAAKKNRALFEATEAP